MSRICFVTPGSVFLLDERVFVNLGILKVAACCRARGHHVEHLDLDGVQNYEDAITAHAELHTVDWYAITATTPQMPQVARIVAKLKQVSHAKIMLGGPHPTLALAATKQERKRGEEGRGSRALAQLMDMVDVVVAGDGEDAVEQGLAVDKGLIDADDPIGPLFLTKKRLNELPLPARDLVDMDSYHYTIDGASATSLIAQLGCPFGCAFCGGRASPMLRRSRIRSTQNILDEMEHLHTAYGYRGFMLYDDELNVNPKMVELMRGIIALQERLGVEFRLRGFVKSELLTQEQCNVMRDAGFRWLLCGFEAGHPRILENIKKGATVEDNTRAVEMAHLAGLKVKALMSIGHAGESHETVKAVRDWLVSVHPQDFDVTIITPYPGSPYYDEARHYGHVQDGQAIWTYTAASGDRLHSVEVDYSKTADYYKGGGEGSVSSYVFTDHLASKELVVLRDKLEADVRTELKIPFNPSRPAMRFEHSMGQGPLPSNVWRQSA